MRIHIKTTPNNTLVDFDYQTNLVGALHKWLGQNQVHNQTSLYSFSWLKGGKAYGKKGLQFKQGASWFISTFDVALLKQLVNGIQAAPEIAFGMVVKEVIIQEVPDFSQGKHTFRVGSPVLIKRARKKPNQKHEQFYYYHDSQASDLLTESLKYKLSKAGIHDDTLRVEFDQSYALPRIKKTSYKGTQIKASFCPVTITGKPESLAFAWQVGVGNSTGIGFGSLV